MQPLHPPRRHPHGTTTGDSNLKLSAFRNPDDTVTVVALNASTSANPVTFSLQNKGITNGTAPRI
ncbi:glycoside hydrolase family 30 beta sandwich domain-containing protein [Streptomyces sp. NPDC047043]|uniref:glycoside hydrolase family 30 beta sandwich domain-containing protein n=1 Tax=Streptomyces sp. NPDC047043 TaxID=3154497 RepID=UPI0033D35EE9